MISEKMKDFTKNSSAIRAMFEDGKKLSKIYGEENVYDFSLGNPSVEPPKEVKEAIYKILETENPNFVHGYNSSNSGYEDVREAIAKSINQKFETNFNLKNVVMTCGAAAGLNIILKCILNPNDEVIVFAPFFGEYSNYIKNYDGKVVIIKPNTKTFQIQLDDFEAKITKNTKAVIINTPNNPTGVIYSEETIKNIAEILERKQKEYNTSIHLISDEPYRELVFDNEVVPYVTKYYKNTFVCYSYSKSLSLPGERIGYVVINNDMDDFENMTTALNVANRINGFVNAPSLIQRVIPYCLNSSVNIEIYNKNRNLLYKMLTDLGFDCIRPNGAFYMFPKALIEDDKEFCAILKENRILTSPGSSFSCPGYFRISYCVSYETIERSYESFKAVAKKYL